MAFQDLLSFAVGFCLLIPVVSSPEYAWDGCGDGKCGDFSILMSDLKVLDSGFGPAAAGPAHPWSECSRGGFSALASRFVTIYLAFRASDGWLSPLCWWHLQEPTKIPQLWHVFLSDPVYVD
ncbi:hypothetical protein CC78DRAFT_581058 [Lojkania enalia]|uniref:Uncharacterized protein n=1 Tax=Lojkania enalia TaxID=147567 RepID=A0A9P4N874_9PLEO|nr:hypothetical protein CC78DRAFT_581058 [Didymosphaeria enalia]